MNIQRVSDRILTLGTMGAVRVMAGKPSAGGDWWDPLGEGLCVLAAYQARGAANYAASKVNLVNPGVNDLTEVGGAVPWDIVRGFMFNAGNYFTTGIVPAGGDYTMLVQFDNNAVAWMFFAGVITATRFHVGSATAGQSWDGWGAAQVGRLGGNTGNYCLARDQFYFNGIANGAPLGGAFGVPNAIALGAANNGSYKATVDEWAVWIGDCALTAPQVLSVSNAMSLL